MCVCVCVCVCMRTCTDRVCTYVSSLHYLVLHWATIRGCCHIYIYICIYIYAYMYTARTHTQICTHIPTYMCTCQLNMPIHKPEHFLAYRSTHTQIHRQTSCSHTRMLCFLTHLTYIKRELGGLQIHREVVSQRQRIPQGASPAVAWCIAIHSVNYYWDSHNYWP